MIRRIFNLTALLTLAAMALLVEGCANEKFEKESVYAVSPRLQMERGGEQILMTRDVKAYLHYADSLQWRPASYEDARQGILTSLFGSETKQPDMVGRVNMDGRLEFDKAVNAAVMIVVCDMVPHGEYQSRIYAWRQDEVIDGITDVYLPVLFCPWQTSSRYTWSKWYMVNENPAQETPAGYERFRENFGTGPATAAPWPTVEQYAPYFENQSPVTFNDPTGTARIEKLAQGANLSDHLVLPANSASSLRIDGINMRGYTGLDIYFDLAASLPNEGDRIDQQVLSVTFNEVEVRPTSRILSHAGGDNEIFFSVHLAMPDTVVGRESNTLLFEVAGQDNPHDLRIDSIRIYGVPRADPNFGQAVFEAKLVVGQAISGATLTLPYSGALGQIYENVTVRVTGAGASGISVQVPETIELTTETGNISFDVTGTPASAGDVVFTISGITGLTAPRNTVSATVAAAEPAE